MTCTQLFKVTSSYGVNKNQSVLKYIYVVDMAKIYNNPMMDVLHEFSNMKIALARNQKALDGLLADKSNNYIVILKAF